METALSTISQLPETRSEQKVFVHKAIEEIVNGGYDPARLFAKLRIIADTIKEITDSETFKQLAIKEINKYGKECVIGGNTLKVASKKAWDFSVCNDSILFDMENKQEQLKNAISERKKFLQTIKSGMEVANPESGEMILPPTYSETEYITVK